MTIRNSELRYAATLLRLGGVRFAGPRDSSEVDVPVMQDELAAASNMSRDTAGSFLRKISQLGLIETGYAEIVLRSPPRLREMVDRS